MICGDFGADWGAHVGLGMTLHIRAIFRTNLGVSKYHNDTTVAFAFGDSGMVAWMGR